MAGTVVITHTREGRIGRIHAVCTGDASDGTFPDTALPAFSGTIVALRTNPGATAPTADYDVTLVNADGLDVLQGVGADRHTSNTEEAAVVRTGTSIHPPVVFEDVLTLNIDNNSVNSAGIVIDILYQA